MAMKEEDMFDSILEIEAKVKDMDKHWLGLKADIVLFRMLRNRLCRQIDFDKPAETQLVTIEKLAPVLAKVESRAATMNMAMQGLENSLEIQKKLCDRLARREMSFNGPVQSSISDTFATLLAQATPRIAALKEGVKYIQKEMKEHRDFCENLSMRVGDGSEMDEDEFYPEVTAV